MLYICRRVHARLVSCDTADVTDTSEIVEGRVNCECIFEGATRHVTTRGSRRRLLSRAPGKSARGRRGPGRWRSFCSALYACASAASVRSAQTMAEVAVPAYKQAVAYTRSRLLTKQRWSNESLAFPVLQRDGLCSAAFSGVKQE